MKIVLFTLSLVAFAASAAAQPIAGEEVIEPTDKQLRQLAALTRDGVAKAVSVTDDSLETLVTLTTAPVWKSNGRFTDKVRSDNFLRAFIDKRTGTVRYQVYQQVTYSGEARRFSTVNYATPAGPVSTEVTPISEEVITCAGSLCVYRDALGFDVSRSVLDHIAARYAPASIEFWRFRFKGRGGLDWEDRIAPAEVAGLLQAVDSRLLTMKH
jgi:hypothetical protein